MLDNGQDLISLFSIVPNIRCLHISLRTMCMFESPLWSSIVLPHLAEFYLWSEFVPLWQIEELTVLLRVMPNVQQLLLSVVTQDARLLDGEQIRLLLSAVNILHLESLHYAVDYCGASFKQSIIISLQEKWLPQSIALIFDIKYGNIFLHTIPFKFQRFWTRQFSPDAKKFSEEQKLPIHYGEGAYITLCASTIPAEFSELYSVMQKASHIEKLRLDLRPETPKNALG